MPPRSILGIEQLAARPQTRRRWVWWAAFEIPLLVLLGAGLRYYRAQPALAPASFDLQVHESREGQLNIEWNRAAVAMAGATRGVLDISDGIERQSMALSPEMLAVGSFSYPRVTDSVQITITIFDLSGTRVQEATGFLGNPPPSIANMNELADLRARRDELEAEMARLKERNDAQSAHIDRLNHSLRVLQAKLGIH